MILVPEVHSLEQPDPPLFILVLPYIVLLYPTVDVELSSWLQTKNMLTIFSLQQAELHVKSGQSAFNTLGKSLTGQG